MRIRERSQQVTMGYILSGVELVRLSKEGG